MAPAPLSFLPLSPSPSPPSEHALFLHDMLAQSQGQHPPVHPHPSLMYHPHASPGSAASSPGFEYPDPMQHASLPQSDSPPPGQAGKRYRSAPPKTFQCAGYGECRMVFSRSEHLARHIRKHTGERPFACHCTKQFSRLDNLRQHAQTVHSAPEDKPLNERMMRALAGVNASMMAGVRGRRRFSPPSSISSSPNCSSSSSAGYPSHPSSQYGGGSHPGSPTTASFAQQQQQRPRQGGEYLPSPPQSPPYYASSHPSSHSHPQHHAQQAYWAGAQAGEGEMSNAQYYAALQHQGEYGQRGNGVHGAQYGAGVYA
ncbi:hypothetical protein FB451DRAFT_290822 [Mycena latifolia]|nr:hypothetical protein FB451DRAFT_290822 [Mycena latifolia]